MTLHSIPTSSVLEALRQRPGDPHIAFALVAIEAAGKDSYTVTESPADILRKTLAERYDFAHERGRTVNGASQLLDRLAQRGATPITGIALDHNRRHVTVFMLAESLDPVGVAILEPDDLNHEETTADIRSMHRAALDALIGPAPLDLGDLQNAEIIARHQALGDYRTPEPGEMNAPGMVMSFDLLLALTIVDPDEPANSWNRGLILEELGRFEDAAHEYVIAAERIRSRLARGVRLVDDDELWADAALLNACRCLLKVRLPLAAAAAARRIDDADHRREAQELIHASPGTAA